MTAGGKELTRRKTVKVFDVTKPLPRPPPFAPYPAASLPYLDMYLGLLWVVGVMSILIQLLLLYLLLLWLLPFLAQLIVLSLE